MYAVMCFFSLESLSAVELFVARPGLVLGWLKSQMLRQILQCRISTLGVGAKAAQSLQTNPQHSGLNG